jgi:hypothetical protein
VSIHLRRIAAGLAVAVVTMLGSAPAYASAAASSDINPVSCASAATWVRLYSAIGEHCYTGNGIKVVDLAGVREMQVSGLHEVCLSTLDPTREICYLTASDTKTVLFSPPIYVRLLTISTP